MSPRTSLAVLVLLSLIAALSPFGASAQQPPAPSIAFRGNGQDINLGDSTPSTSDGTDFGSTTQGEPVIHIFSVRNAGDANLVIDEISVPSGFSYSSPGLSLPRTLLPGFSIVLLVSCDATAIGTIEDVISISSNDPVNSRAGFTVVCRVDGLPEIDVSGNSVPIADGSTTPGTSNGTDFGNVLLNAPLTRTFRVSNRGQGDLTIGGVTLPAGFTALNSLPATIPPSSGADLQVRCDAARENTYVGDIVIANNDQDEARFNFRIRCVVGDGEPDFNPGQDDLPPPTSTVTAPPVVVVTPPPSGPNPNTGGNTNADGPFPAPTVAGGGSVINQVPTAPLPTAAATPRAAATTIAPATPEFQGLFRPPATGSGGLVSGDTAVSSRLVLAAVGGCFLTAIVLARIRLRSHG